MNSAKTQLAWAAAVFAFVGFVGIHLSKSTGNEQISNYSPSGAEIEGQSAVLESSQEVHEQASDGRPDSPQISEPKSGTAIDPDELALMREEISGEVRDQYLLVLEHLDLAKDEREALLEFLIEEGIMSAKTPFSDGERIEDDERTRQIAALIGIEKTEELLGLERHLGEYRELRTIQSLLKDKGVPLSEHQRDGLLQILIDVRADVDMTRPSHLDPSSIESLEFTLGQLDEYDRLVTELAPSKLSGEQVGFMFERNQVQSYRRAESLEWHKRRETGDAEDEVALGYPSKRD